MSETGTSMLGKTEATARLGRSASAPRAYGAGAFGSGVYVARGASETVAASLGSANTSSTLTSGG